MAYGTTLFDLKPYSGVDDWDITGNLIDRGDFGGKYLAPINPIGRNYKYSESNIVGGVGAIPLTDYKEGPRDVMLSGQMHATTPDGMFTGLMDNITESIRKFNADPIRYLNLALWTGSAYIGYRMYCYCLGIEVPYAPKTRLTVSQPYGIRFRCFDPYIYSGFEQSDLDTIVNGAGTHAFVQSNNGQHQRWILKIKNVSAGVFSDPTITDAAGASFTIDGALALNDYWEIDFLNGRIRRWNGSTFIDDIGLFSGDWLELQVSVTSLTVAATHTGNCELSSRWLRRQF